MSEPPKVVSTGMTESQVEKWLDRVDETMPVEKRPTPPPEYGPLYEGCEEEAERREEEEFQTSSPSSFYTPTSEVLDWLPVEDHVLIDLFNHPVPRTVSSMESLPPPAHPHLYPTRQAYERMIDMSFLKYVTTSLFVLVVVVLMEVVMAASLLALVVRELIEVVEIDRLTADLLTA